jgi:hypothetical protein
MLKQGNIGNNRLKTQIIGETLGVASQNKTKESLLNIFIFVSFCDTPSVSPITFVIIYHLVTYISEYLEFTHK